jgi:hypothetical protein
MEKENIERDKILNSDKKNKKKRLSVILRKLKDGGTDAISDDEYQFIKLTDILHAEIHADESALCSPEDFDNNDEHCRKCETFESCLMREIKKYL